MIIKVTLLLGAILVLCTAAVIKTPTESSVIVDGCKSETELWPSEDGTKFYFCIGDNKSMEQSCEPNTFFVHNDTICGCVPLAEVSDNCVYHSIPGPCEGINLLQPQPHPNPTKFYFCPKMGADPVELPCPAEKAFLKQNGWMGCFIWTLWRNIRGCNPTEYTYK